MFFISPGLRFLKIDCFPLSIPVLQNLFKYWSGKKGTRSCRSNYCPYRFWGFFYIFVYILSKLSYKLENVLTSKKKNLEKEEFILPAKYYWRIFILLQKRNRIQMTHCLSNYDEKLFSGHFLEEEQWGREDL